MWKRRGFFDHWNCNKKSTWKAWIFDQPNCVKNFSTSETKPKKVHGNNMNFWPSKSRRKKYMETMWIFRSSKLCRKKFMETTWIIWSEKLYWKSMWQWHGNSSKFGLRRIHVISTCIQHGVPIWYIVWCLHLLPYPIEANGFDNLSRHLNQKVLVAVNCNYVISLSLEEWKYWFDKNDIFPAVTY